MYRIALLALAAGVVGCGEIVQPAPPASIPHMDGLVESGPLPRDSGRAVNGRRLVARFAMPTRDGRVPTEFRIDVKDLEAELDGITAEQMLSLMGSKRPKERANHEKTSVDAASSLWTSPIPFIRPGNARPIGRPALPSAAMLSPIFIYDSTISGVGYSASWYDEQFATTDLAFLNQGGLRTQDVNYYYSGGLLDHATVHAYDAAGPLLYVYLTAEQVENGGSPIATPRFVSADCAGATQTAVAKATTAAFWYYMWRETGYSHLKAKAFKSAAGAVAAALVAAWVCGTR